MTEPPKSFSELNKIFKEIYNDEYMRLFEEKLANEALYGKFWTNLEMKFGGPKVLEKIKNSKLGKILAS